MNRLALLSLLLLPATLSAQTIGGLIMSGDPRFDSDSLVNRDANQWRWLSYPGARFSLNPASAGRFLVEPMAKDLPLNLGGYLGTKVLRLRNVANVRVVAREATDVNAGLAAAVTTAWYPYKLTFEAEFPSGVTASGEDFFVDADSTLVRRLTVRGPAGSDLYLSGKIVGAGGARWLETEHTLLVSDPKYQYALHFVALSPEAGAPMGVRARPEIQADSWILRIPLRGESDLYAITFGFAAASEAKDKAVERAAAALPAGVPAASALARSKAAMDGILRKVPKPAHWGIDGIKADGVTPEQHRRAYYAAWAFLVQDVMNVFPENPAYPYPQVGVGKPSLWDSGEETSPGTCSWESLLGYQWLSHLMPDLAWRAYEGMMSRVDAEGKLGGESLPSRKAQTAWVLFKQTGDRVRLGKVYPAVKRYLLWRERNLRWIYKEHNFADEKDLEFVVSWLVDIGYAGQIASELGLAEDVKLWQGKVEPMVANMRAWFFSDPTYLHQYMFTSRNQHENHNESSVYIVTGLATPGLPDDMLQRLQRYFRRVHNPDRSNDGFAYSKYPDNNFIALGLVEHEMPEARPFMQAILRDSIRIGEFTECMLAGPKVEGVRPSLFTALNIIDFTWMLNGVRVDDGTPQAFVMPGGATETKSAN